MEQQQIEAERFTIRIRGCWRYGRAGGKIPQYPGIYFLFEAKKDGEKTVPIRLLFVGSADNVRDGILAFNRIFHPAKYLRHGNFLCYHTAAVPSAARERVMAAFIYTHKPPANDRYKYKFPFPPTWVQSEGKTVFLKENFTV